MSQPGTSHPGVEDSPAVGFPAATMQPPPILAGGGCDAPVGRLHSWDIATGADGPGTRFVAFLAGCPLRCLYCHNPDTWLMRSGKLVGVGEMARQFGRYQRFVTLAGGGVTISGGEPLMQPRFTTALLRAAKELGLHTAVDTSGFPGLRDKEFAEPLLAHTDLVLLDIKARHAASFRRLTGVSVRPTLRFATQLAKRGIPVWLRYVLVPGVTDEVDEVSAVARFAAALGNVERVDVLPFHRLGAAKYTELGLTYPLAEVAPPTPDQLTRVRQQFQDRGLFVT